MENFMRGFVEAIYRNQDRFLPMVPLGDTVKLGDLLFLRKEGRKDVEYVGNIADPKIGVQITVGQDEKASDQKWQNTSGISVEIKLAGVAPKIGSALSEAEAGLIVRFSKEKSFLFQPLGIKYNRIENLITVRSELIKKLTAGQFDSRELWLVKQIASVSSYALAISISDQGSLEVSAKTGISSLQLKDLAKVDLGLTVKRSNDLGFYEVGAEGGALFFKAEKMVLQRELPGETRNLLGSTPGLRAGGALLDLPHAILRSRLVKRAITFREMTLEDLDALF